MEVRIWYHSKMPGRPKGKHEREHSLLEETILQFNTKQEAVHGSVPHFAEIEEFS